MRKIFVFLFPLFIFLLLSCQNEKSSSEKAIQYPNQDAPLALLMRDMYLDMEEIRKTVANKESIESYLEKHRELLTAAATDPKVKDVTFEMMGNAYLKSLENLENSSQELLGENYITLVNTCLGCHQQYCPGPVKRINKLILE
jgi:thioredoxin-related protein